MEENIQLSDQVILKDMNGDEYVIFKMYCNITANKSISFVYDILLESAFQPNLTLIQEKVAAFKVICYARASASGVPIF